MTDLNPLPWTLEDWLDAFDTLAQQQDLERLHRAITDAEHNHRIRGHRNPQSLDSWSERIATEKLGWSGPGQTNDKLKIFACEARVFLGMDSIGAIAEYIEQLAKLTPGFYEHSSHIKDIISTESRCGDMGHAVLLADGSASKPRHRIP